MLPEAVEDIFNQKNDTIQLKFRTKALEDYGDIKLSIDNPSSRNVIIQIINNRDETIKEKSVCFEKKKVLFEITDAEAKKHQEILDSLL